MSFLLDTNTISDHLKRPSASFHRFVQHSGRLAVPTIVLGELYTWAYGRSDPSMILGPLEDLAAQLEILPFDVESARSFGKLRVLLSRGGVTVDPVDLMIASMALVHDLTLVTDNTRHFVHVPDLRLVNWLASCAAARNRLLGSSGTTQRPRCVRRRRGARAAHHPAGSGSGSAMTNSASCSADGLCEVRT
jgi:tRNA(fMet)-specific endonuclease VapC